MSKFWRLFCLLLVAALSVWLAIGNVVAVEAICSTAGWSVIGKAAILTVLGLADCLAAAFIVWGPLDALGL